MGPGGRGVTRRAVVRAGVVVALAVVAACSVAGTAYAGTGLSDLGVTSRTVYADDGGSTAGTVSKTTVLLHATADPTIAAGDSATDSAKDDGDGGSAVCTVYLTQPHATPESPRDGDIYVEGEAHAECASTRVDVKLATAIEWRLDYGVNGSEGSSGTHYQPGASTSCSGSARCPRTGELVAPWGHVSHCYETGTYHATTVVLSGSFTYRGTRYDLGGVRSVTTAGSYGKGC